jgi:hypothetical protein
MKKLILHVGYPKTATTSLQASLFFKLDSEINYLGITKASVSEYHNLARSTLRPYLTSEGKDGVEDLSALLADRLVHGTNVLSEESFLNSRSNPGHIFDPVTIKNLLMQFCDSIEIVIVLRNQVDLIYSLYAYGGVLDEYGGTRSANKYITTCLESEESRSFFCFSDVIKKYKSVFNKTNVHVLLFEDFLSDKGLYLNKWGDILGVGSEILAGAMGDVHLNQKKQNLDGLYTLDVKSEPNTLKRLIKRVPLAHSVFAWLSKYDAIQNISVASNNPVDKKLVVPRFSEEDKHRIREAFAQSNLELVDLINIDREKLRSYHYL